MQGQTSEISNFQSFHCQPNLITGVYDFDDHLLTFLQCRVHSTVLMM